jgi:hypothetical protein
MCYGRLAAVPSLAVLLLGCHFSPKDASAWQRTYTVMGVADGSSVQQTSDGGYVVLGTTMSFEPRDTAATHWGDANVYLLRLDEFGDTLWSRRYGGTCDDYGNSVQQTSDGGYIVAGTSSSFGRGDADVYLAKVDSSGHMLWSRTYGGHGTDVVWSVRQTRDGGYVLAGKTNSFSILSDFDAYLVRTNSDGDTMWTRTYGCLIDDAAYSVDTTSDGGFIVAGSTESSVSGGMYLLKVDGTGETLWTRYYGQGGGYANEIRQTTDGGYVFVGSPVAYQVGSAAYVVRIDKDGLVLWDKLLADSTWDLQGSSINQTRDGGYVIAGSQGYSFCLIKLSCLGNVLWMRSYGEGRGHCMGDQVDQTIDGGFVLVGSCGGLPFRYSEAYVVKVDSLGRD